jgi:hypothetical protein
MQFAQEKVVARVVSVQKIAAASTIYWLLKIMEALAA